MTDFINRKAPTAPIEIVQREIATDFDVRSARREIEGVAVPYGVAESVSDDGEHWYEEGWRLGVFARMCMPANTGRVRLNFTHDESDKFTWVGRTKSLRESAEGLIGLWHVDETPFGDTALYKAATGQMPGLSVSAGVLRNVREGGVVWRALANLRHVALVEQGAFRGALVTSVRQRQRPAREPVEVGSVERWQQRLERLKASR